MQVTQYTPCKSHGADVRIDYLWLGEMMDIGQMDAPESEGQPTGSTHSYSFGGQSFMSGHGASVDKEHRYNVDTKTPNKGGKRAGSGRKALDDSGTIVITARLTAKQKATYDMIGGVSWLRSQLDMFAGDGN